MSHLPVQDGKNNTIDSKLFEDNIFYIYALIDVIWPVLTICWWLKPELNTYNLCYDSGKH